MLRQRLERFKAAQNSDLVCEACEQKSTTSIVVLRCAKCQSRFCDDCACQTAVTCDASQWRCHHCISVQQYITDWRRMLDEAMQFPGEITVEAQAGEGTDIVKSWEIVRSLQMAADSDVLSLFPLFQVLRAQGRPGQARPLTFGLFAGPGVPQGKILSRGQASSHDSRPHDDRSARPVH